MNEITILSKIQDWRGAPKIYDYWICEDKGFFVMELLYQLNIPKDKIWENFLWIIDKFNKGKGE